MSIFDDIKKLGIKFRLNEEILYAEALREMESGARRDGLWAKSLSDSEFNESKAKALYIKLRVQSLRDEIFLFIKENEKKLANKKIHSNIQPQNNYISKKNLPHFNKKNEEKSTHKNILDKPKRPNAKCPLCLVGVMVDSKGCWSCGTLYMYEFKPKNL